MKIGRSHDSLIFMMESLYQERRSFFFNWAGSLLMWLWVSHLSWWGSRSPPTASVDTGCPRCPASPPSRPASSCNTRTHRMYTAPTTGKTHTGTQDVHGTNHGQDTHGHTGCTRHQPRARHSHTDTQVVHGTNHGQDTHGHTGCTRHPPRARHSHTRTHRMYTAPITGKTLTQHGHTGCTRHQPRARHSHTRTHRMYTAPTTGEKFFITYKLSLKIKRSSLVTVRKGLTVRYIGVVWSSIQMYGGVTQENWPVFRDIGSMT